jgi:hypothetical protein
MTSNCDNSICGDIDRGGQNSNCFEDRNDEKPEIAADSEFVAPISIAAAVGLTTAIAEWVACDFTFRFMSILPAYKSGRAGLRS